MTQVCDHHEAIKALREVVAGNEDYIYEPPGVVDVCVYEYNGQSSCLIGKALRARFPEVRFPGNTSSIRYFHDDGYKGFADSTDGVGPPVEGVEITPEASRILYRAQGLQDDEYTWGEALQFAEEEYLHILEREGENGEAEAEGSSEG